MSSSSARKRKHQSRSDEPKNNQYRSKNKHSKSITKSITKSNMPKMKSSISLSFLQFCLASILLSGGYAQNSQCVTPTGIGDSNGVIYSDYNFTGATLGIFGVSYSQNAALYSCRAELRALTCLLLHRCFNRPRFQKCWR